MERGFLSLKNGLAEASNDMLRCLFGRLLPIAPEDLAGEARWWLPVSSVASSIKCGAAG